MLKYRTPLIFLLSIILGFLVWWLSLSLTGALEPWDAKNGYYFLVLGGTGVINGFLGGRRFWLWPIGTFIGELTAIVVRNFSLPTGDVNFFIPVGLIVLIIYLVPSFIGSAIGVSINAKTFKKAGANQK